ncbi:MAG: glycosyltransferase [Candidatus Helarchaeota archaeon]
MRIGFFTDTYHQINGVTTIIQSLERELHKRGHEIFIFAPRGKGDYKRKKPNLFTSESVRLILNPEYKWAIFPIFSIKVTNELDLDIIHVHSPLSMGLSGLFNGKRLGIPVVGTVHTLIPEFWKDFVVKLLPYVAPPILDKIFKPIIREAVDFYSLFMQHFSWRYFARYFNQCDVVTVPSTYAQQLCIKNGINNPIILPNGVEFSKFQHSDASYDFYERWNLRKDEIIFLSVGRLSEEKNLEVLLHSMKDICNQFNNVKLLIIGDGQQATKLKHLTERLEIQESVIFASFVKHDELGLCYKHADWLIITSPHETFGLTAVEAMHFGCPVLGVNSGGITDIIENKKNGLFFNGKSQALTEKLQYIIKNRKKLNNFRKNAKIRSEKYEIRNCTNELIKLYEKLLRKTNLH